MACTIGIDIGGTRIKAAIVNEDGTLVNKSIVETNSSEGYSLLLRQIANIIYSLRDEASECVTAVGTGVAGLMDSKNYRIITAPNVKVISGRALATDLAKVIDMPVVMDNDANVMAIGEGCCGAGRNSKHYIAITLGTGVGGAVISDGQLVRGFAGGGGEVGHIPISIEGPACGCGSFGCLEAYIGHAGIINYINKTFPTLKQKSIKSLNQMAIEGDKEALQVFTYIGSTLAVGLAGLINVFNPEIIIIGGGISAAENLLFDPLWKELKLRAFDTYTANLAIRRAELGNWAGVVGGGVIARKLA